MSRLTTALTLLTLFISLMACGKKDEDDTTSAELAASASAVGEAILGSLDTRSPRLTPSRGACSAIAFSSCDTASGKKRRFFSPDGGDSEGCSAGSDEAARTVFGAAILQFAGTSNCGFNTDDTITRTVTNHYLLDSDEHKTLVYTDEGTVGGQTITTAELRDYVGDVRAGGTVLKKGSAELDTLTIKGVHRRRVFSNGKFGFWHTLYADGVSVGRSTSGGQTTLTVNGAVTLMHNRARAKVTKTYTDAVFREGCYFPVGGTVKFNTVPESGSPSELTATFQQTCGSVSIDGETTSLAGGE